MSMTHTDLIYYCSNCEVALSSLPPSNLCPNCGKLFGINKASKADVGSPLNRILQIKQKEREISNDNTSNYYVDQMELLIGDPATVIVKFEDNKTRTKWMSLNTDSINAIINWLMIHKGYVK